MLPLVFSTVVIQAPAPKAGLYGHLEYGEAPSVSLGELGGIQVRMNVLEPLSKLLEAAHKDGISLKVAAGFRSVALQRSLFEVGAKKKGISQKAYAWWTAPPGYSEHHTGLAVDFVDPEKPKTNFAPVLFSKTAAYAWLKVYGPKFGFELSFPGGHGLPVAFEPWHWRYVGDEESRAIFAVARPGRAAQYGSSDIHSAPVIHPPDPSFLAPLIRNSL